MALSIKETPILQGKDARRFEKALKECKKVSKEEYDRAMKVYKKLKKKGFLV